MRIAYKATSKWIMLPLLLAALGGCADRGATRSFAVAVGSIAGGVLGSQIGQGTGRAAAAALGAVTGGFVAAQGVAWLDARDRERHELMLSDTLENSPTGVRQSWQNPDSGASGHAVAGAAQMEGEQPCRTFETEVRRGAQEAVQLGRACRNADGSWTVVQQG